MTPGSTIDRRTAASGIALAGLLVAFGGALHPRADARMTFDEGLARMLESSAWAASHALTMTGYVVLAVALALFLRGRDRTGQLGLRLVGWGAVAAAGLAAVESVPHLLAATEAAALRAGEATPLTDAHKLLQVVATPALGLSVAALAIAGARSGALDGGLVPMSLAVLGGSAFALAGPAIALTERSDLSPLFSGAAGMAVWAIVAGIRTARRLGREPVDVLRADPGRALAATDPGHALAATQGRAR